MKFTRIFFLLFMVGGVASRSYAAPQTLSVEENSASYRDGTLQMTTIVDPNQKSLNINLTWPKDGHQSSWNITLADLKHVIKCADYIDPDRPSEFCVAGCICKYPTLLAFDEKRGEAIIGVPNDVGSNIPWDIIGAQLNSRKMRQIYTPNAVSSGYDSISLSPNGRYLAYSRGNHASGSCYGGSFPGVFDTANKQEIDVPLKEFAHPVAVFTKSSRWLSDESVTFEQTYWDCDEKNNRTNERNIELNFKIPRHNQSLQPSPPR